MLPRITNLITSKCACCGNVTDCLVCCSAFGAFSFSACLSCIKEGKEPYRNMVSYIANAGHWPEDINEIYQEEVRYQLRLHNIPEEIFKFDVDREIAEEQAFILNYCKENANLNDIMNVNESEVI